MRILVATDGSDCSRLAVAEVARRPWPADSRIDVVAVVDIGYRGAPQFGPISPEYFDSLERALEDASDQVLADAVEALAPCASAGIEVTRHRLIGPPAMAILDHAEATGVDLIVVGSHGRSALGRLLLGSVSHAILVHAHCSVEVVRKPST